MADLSPDEQRFFDTLFPNHRMRRKDGTARAETFGDWLSRARAYQSVVDCAASLGKHRDWWDKIEHGEYLPSEAEVEAIARAVGVHEIEGLEVAGYVSGTIPDAELLQRLSFCM